VGCFVCGARQTDPVKGGSPWQRGVVRNEQVLGCPDCQASGAWTAVLDRCGSCGATALVRRLGETACRSCGHVGESVPVPSVSPARSAERDAIAAEVAAALDRAFGRD
jgi:hypothetical protein